MTLAKTAKRLNDPNDQGAKPIYIYERYETYFSEYVDRPITMLELGVHKGDSLKVFASYFRKGKVIGIDIAKPSADFSDYPNAIFKICDQRDTEQLRSICATHAPDGLDIIIDDASHFGSWSLVSYETLFPLLKPNGFYVAEDWITGYWDDWPDGVRYQRLAPDVPRGQMPRRVPSHDGGMVGFVKFLIDEIPAIPATTLSSAIVRQSKIEWVHVNDAFAIAKKRGI